MRALFVLGLCVCLCCSLQKGARAVEFELGIQVERNVTVSVSSNGEKRVGEKRVGEKREATIPFLLYVPKSYGQDDKAWPLLLFLHGLGECGEGNLDLVKIHGPPKLVDRTDDFEFIVVSPQCPPKEFDEVPTAWEPDQLIKLIDHVSKSLRIDDRRTYVTGLSMGGFGTWRLIGAYPDRFAAAVPICGGGNPATSEKIAKLPIWSFHGQDDDVVPLKQSERMVEAVKKSGGNAKLTVYPQTGHDSWTRTYENPEVFRWLLSHQRGE